MKDNARMNDYLQYLEKQINDAKKSGKDSLILTAKDAHNAVSIKPTLPTCCAAMKKFMKVGDEILSAPATKTGVGGSLRIQYMVNDRDEMHVTYQIDGNRISVDGTYGKWMIIMDLPKKGPKLNFSGKIYELLTEADESYEKYSLAINSNLSYETQWKKLPDTIKHKLNLTLLKVTPKNKVVEI